MLGTDVVADAIAPAIEGECATMLSEAAFSRAGFQLLPGVLPGAFFHQGPLVVVTDGGGVR